MTKGFITLCGKYYGFDKSLQIVCSMALNMTLLRQIHLLSFVEQKKRINYKPNKVLRSVLNESIKLNISVF